MHRQSIPKVKYQRVRFEYVPSLPRAQNVDSSGILITTTQIIVAPKRAESNDQELRWFAHLSHIPNYLLVIDCGEITCYKEAIHIDDSKKWEMAMQSEYNSILANKTWYLTSLPEGKQALPCKWIYKKNYSVEDLDSNYKARLVANGGYVKTCGIGYEETFAHVAKMVVTMRIVIVVALSTGWIMHQIDVKNAFLNGKLQEEVYYK